MSCENNGCPVVYRSLDGDGVIYPPRSSDGHDGVRLVGREIIGDTLADVAPVAQVGGFLGISMEFIARLLISALFVTTGLYSALNFSEYSEVMQRTGIPYPSLVAVLSIFLQVVGGLFFTGILAVYNSVSLGKLALIIFTVLSTAVNYNAFKDPSKLEGMLKNLAILGGLLLS